MRARARTALAALAAVCVASYARADEGRVVVVNAAATAEARAATASRAAEVRRALVARALARELSEPLRAAVEGDPATVFRLDLGAAQRAYAQFEYQRAQQLLDDDAAEALATADSDALPGALAEIFFWRGVVAVAQRDRSAARRWFLASLRLRPARVVDRERFPPRVRNAFAAAQATAGKLADANLEVAVTPEPAWIAVDDRTPVEPHGALRVGAGIHLVVAGHRGAGFERHAQLVDVTPGRRVRLAIELSPEPREVAARRAIAGAVAARSPSRRLRRWRELADVASAPRLLALEQGSDGSLQARLYDVTAGAFSRPVPLGRDGATDAIAELAAARVVDLLPPLSESASRDAAVSRAATAPPSRHAPRWYRRWWVWAAIGAVTASAATSLYFGTRDQEPRLHGFGEAQ